MDRRRFISLSGLSLSALLAGCSNTDTENGNSGDSDQNDIPEVSVTSTDYSSQSPVHTLSVSYNTSTAASLNPPNTSAGRDPDNGNKFVVIHAEVTVESELENQIEVYGSIFKLQSTGIVHDGVSIRNVSSLTETIMPKSTFDGWLAFEVATDVTEAILTARDVELYFDNGVSVNFERSSSINADLTEL